MQTLFTCYNERVAIFSLFVSSTFLTISGSFRGLKSTKMCNVRPVNFVTAAVKGHGCFQGYVCGEVMLAVPYLSGCINPALKNFCTIMRLDLI